MRSQTQTLAIPAAPSEWRDLKRDWQRWSKRERLAARLALAGLAVGGALAPMMLGTLL